ncbi:MAG: hypothetical protein AB2556_23375 [Candidatus Thiodiazotropha sp.]
MATDILYIRKTALHKLEGVEAYVPPKRFNEGSIYLPKERDTDNDSALAYEALVEWTECELGLPANPVTPAQWRDKGEELRMPEEPAAYLPKPDYVKATREFDPSTAPHHDGLLSRQSLSYLNGGRGQRQNHPSDVSPEEAPRLHPDPSPRKKDAG